MTMEKAPLQKVRIAGKRPERNQMEETSPPSDPKVRWIAQIAGPPATPAANRIRTRCAGDVPRTPSRKVPMWYRNAACCTARNSFIKRPAAIPVEMPVKMSIPQKTAPKGNASSCGVLLGCGSRVTVPAMGLRGARNVSRRGRECGPTGRSARVSPGAAGAHRRAVSPVPRAPASLFPSGRRRPGPGRRGAR